VTLFLLLFQCYCSLVIPVVRVRVDLPSAFRSFRLCVQCFLELKIGMSFDLLNPTSWYLFRELQYRYDIKCAGKACYYGAVTPAIIRSPTKQQHTAHGLWILDCVLHFKTPNHKPQPQQLLYTKHPNVFRHTYTHAYL
jgi:hypothetical protein